MTNFLVLQKMKFRCYLQLLIILVALVALFRSEEATPEKPTKLTSRNFHDILSMDDPWIVVFAEEYNELKERELIALTNSVAGLIQIGVVDMEDPDSDELIEAKVCSSLINTTY